MAAPVTAGASGYEVAEAFDPLELRSTLLFWDRIDVPSSNAIPNNQMGADEDFLMAEGILVQTGIAFVDWQDADTDANAGYHRAHLKAFELRDDQEPGFWSFGRSKGSLGMDELLKAPDRALEFALFGAIPIPDGDVPLEEVLDFKERRRAELLNLRSRLNAVYQSVLAAPDREVAEVIERAALDQALSEHARVAYESKLKLKWTNLNVKLSLKDFIAAGGAYAWATGMAHLPLTEATLIAAGVGGFSFVQSLGIGAGIADRKSAGSPLEYVTSIHSELRSHNSTTTI
jgi:hypothetical protein